MGSMSTFEIVVAVGLVVYSISLHELAHSWTATWCGDPTPGKHGRLTWNPIVQLDPFYSILMPVAGFFLMGFPFGFAYTPVDPSRYRKPLRDGAFVGVSGPLTNILLALLFLGLLWVPGLADPPAQNCRIFYYVAYWNLLLACFNLLPIPGLDGYDIMRPALPLSLRTALDGVRRMGFISIILIFVVGMRLLPLVFYPVSRVFHQLVPEDAIYYMETGRLLTGYVGS